MAVILTGTWQCGLDWASSLATRGQLIGAVNLVRGFGACGRRVELQAECGDDLEDCCELRVA